MTMCDMHIARVSRYVLLFARPMTKQSKAKQRSALVKAPEIATFALSKRLAEGISEADSPPEEPLWMSHTYTKATSSWPYVIFFVESRRTHMMGALSMIWAETQILVGTCIPTRQDYVCMIRA
jgi:hypothetical protein